GPVPAPAAAPVPAPAAAVHAQAAPAPVLAPREPALFPKDWTGDPELDLNREGKGYRNRFTKFYYQDEEQAWQGLEETQDFYQSLERCRVRPGENHPEHQDSFWRVGTLKEWNLPALFKNWRAKRLATSMPIFLDR
ncbi:unnamed protein product, partial [Durusdinium trenchii]